MGEEGKHHSLCHIQGACTSHCTQPFPHFLGHSQVNTPHQSFFFVRKLAVATFSCSCQWQCKKTCPVGVAVTPSHQYMSLVLSEAIFHTYVVVYVGACVSSCTGLCCRCRCVLVLAAVGCCWLLLDCWVNVCGHWSTGVHCTVHS